MLGLVIMLGFGKVPFVYEVLYLVLEAEVIVGFVARFLVVMAIFIEVPRGRYGIRHRCGV